MAAFPTIGPSLGLAAYAESMIEGRRVIVFGDARSPIAEALIERGARLVHVSDPDPARVGEAAARSASTNVSYGPLGDGGLRDGSFDVALVENLAAFAEIDVVVKLVRRALSPRGVALVASPNPDSETRLFPHTSRAEIPDYYRLYDLVSNEFAEVRMVGQAPLVGYTVADFAPDGEPTPVFDTGFLEGGAEEPEWFVAVASQMPIKHAEFVVVELPARDVLQESSSRELQAPLEQARARVAELEAELKRRPEPRPKEDPRVQALTAELEKRDRWIRALEARADTADARADTAESELEALRERAQMMEIEERALESKARELESKAHELESKAHELEEKLGEAEARAERLAEDEVRAQKLAEAEARAQKLAEELAAKSGGSRELEELERQSAEELGKFEEQLVERGQRIAELERQLADAQRLGRELVAELGQHQPSPAAMEALKAELDSLAALNAEREADLEAARWSIQSLELELGRAPDAEGRPNG